MKNNTFVGNTGHFDNEIDFAHTEGFEGTEVDHIKPQKVVLVSSCWSQCDHDEAFEGFFSHFFPDFKKVRSSTASAEMTRQVDTAEIALTLSVVLVLVCYLSDHDASNQFGERLLVHVKEHGADG